MKKPKNTNLERDSNQSNIIKLFSVIFAVCIIVAIPFYITQVFNHAEQSTDLQLSLNEDNQKQAKINQTKNDLSNLIKDENAKFGFTNTLEDYKSNTQSQGSKWKVAWQTNFGDINIDLNSNDAPQTVVNFIRLNSRQKYLNTTITRVAKEDKINIIQGGDIDKLDGTGGQSAYYVNDKNDNLIPDENWKSKPDIDLSTGETKGGIVPNAELYKNFNPKTGEIEFSKGLILMAKKKYPDSASSQFFITLEKTILPAQYTVFGVINPDSYNTLDKIYKEVNVSKEAVSNSKVISKTDGFPDKEIKITKTEFTKI